MGDYLCCVEREVGGPFASSFRKSPFLYERDRFGRIFPRQGSATVLTQSVLRNGRKGERGESSIASG